MIRKLWTPRKEYDYGPRDYGYYAWTCDPEAGLAGANNVAPGSNSIVAVRIKVPETFTLTTVDYVQGTAGSSLTTGQNFIGVYRGNSPFTQIAVSADITTTFNTGTGIKSVPMVDQTQVIQGGPGVFVYVAIVSNGTTPPKLYNAGIGSQSSGVWNLNMTSGVDKRCVAAGTATTALPGTLVPTGANQSTLYWYGLR